MKWFPRAAGVVERVPVLVADAKTWCTWRGQTEPNDSFDMLEGVVGVTELDGRAFVPFGYEGGVFDVGVEDGVVIVLQHFDSDDENKFSGLRHALETQDYEEYLAGEIEIGDGVIVGDSWSDGTKLDVARMGSEPHEVSLLVFFAPLPAGKYLVLEGISEDHDAQWYRIARGNAADFKARE